MRPKPWLDSKNLDIPSRGRFTGHEYRGAIETLAPIQTRNSCGVI